MKTTSTTKKSATPIIFMNGDIKERDSKRYGKGRTLDYVSAIVVPGEYIRLQAEKEQYSQGATIKVTHENTFKVGDTAVYGSYNFIYTGKIIAISEKTVTIEEPYGEGSKRHRLSLYEFCWRNDDFDLDAICKLNHETMLHI